MTTITLVCALGMSTSLMVTQMNLAAVSMEIDVKIRAVPESSFDEYAADTNILLLGPQVGYKLNKMKKKYEPQGIKVEVINGMDYGTMNGGKVLKDALALLK